MPVSLSHTRLQCPDVLSDDSSGSLRRVGGPNRRLGLAGVALFAVAWLLSSAVAWAGEDAGDVVQQGEAAVRIKVQSIGQLNALKPSDATIEAARGALSAGTPATGSIAFGDETHIQFPGNREKEPPIAAQRTALADVVIFISLSMGEDHLRRLFADAVEMESQRHVTFVLRGWHPPNIQGVLRSLQRLFPVVGDLNRLPNVVIDPTKFRSESVDRVPVALVRNSNGLWKRITGEAELQFIVQAAERSAGEAFAGVTHAVAEPDVLALMEQRARSYDFSTDIERAKKTAFRSRFSTSLPQATVTSSHLFDPSIRVSKDILDHEGRVAVAAGTMANALQHISWSRQYVFLDASSDWQIARGVEWAQRMPTTFFLQNAPEDVEGMREIKLKLGGPVYPTNPYLIERLGVNEVPSLVEQAGDRLRITTSGESNNE